MCESISYHSIGVVVSIENLENVKQQLQFGLCRAIIFNYLCFIVFIIDSRRTLVRGCYDKVHMCVVCRLG